MWTKWQAARGTASDRKYVVANADEGDAGTYCDRMIMEGDPFRLIEGMVICARSRPGLYLLSSGIPGGGPCFEGGDRRRGARWLVGSQRERRSSGDLPRCRVLRVKRPRFWNRSKGVAASWGRSLRIRQRSSSGSVRTANRRE